MSFMDSLGRSKVNTKDVPVQRVGPLIVAILAITMVAFIAYISMSEILYDNDTWFLLNTGRDIVAHGVPHEEQFGMFTGVRYIAQQWLYAYLLWGVYDMFGALGPVILMYLLWVGILLISLQLIKGGQRSIGRDFGDAAKLNTAYLLAAFTVLVGPVFKLNPRIFDILTILLSALIWQHFAEKRRPAVLLAYVPMAALFINLHGALWPLSFAVPFLGMVLQRGLSKKERLIVFGVLCLMLAATFLNPYGLDMHLYIIRSMGVISNMGIVEMRAPRAIDRGGMAGIALIVFLTLYIYTRAKSGRLREINRMWLVILLGAIFVTLLQERNYSLLLPCVIVFMGSVDLSSRRLLNLGVAKNCMNCATIIVICLGASTLLTVRQSTSHFDYDDFDRISHIIESGYAEAAADTGADKWAQARSRTTILCYNSSPYLEFKYGYRCFIDPRFEIWSEKLNGKYDYLSQVNDIGDNKNVKPILDQYKFTYVLTDNDVDPQLYEDAGYSQIYQSERDPTRRLFVRNDYDGIPNWVRS